MNRKRREKVGVKWWIKNNAVVGRKSKCQLKTFGLIQKSQMEYKSNRI